LLFHAADERLIETELVAEIAKDQRLVVARRLRDLVHACAAEPPLREDLFGRAENGCACRLGVALATTSSRFQHIG
jgi:hypothetical protein